MPAGPESAIAVVCSEGDEGNGLVRQPLAIKDQPWPGEWWLLRVYVEKGWDWSKAYK